eukprot:TRINITY_DN8874_c0_g1_i1.p1 TRINITY_DN8874_c0_g1~~TRINITY_DN8874_c0_g1_i1.p1  ORF type:complete len:317 (-),score=116.25 TRINITY_DN8874_c0_g1_i1:118-1011(-)
MAWITDRFTIGEWTPIRWQFFVGIGLILLSFVGYCIVKLIWLGILAIVDRLLPADWKIDNDIRKYCTRPVCWIGPIVLWFAAINLLDFPEGTATGWLNTIALAWLLWQIGVLGIGIINVLRDAVHRNRKQSAREAQGIGYLVIAIKILWVVWYGLFALNNLGINIDNFVMYSVVLVGLTGVFAKRVLSNFVAGFSVTFAAPFVLGDRVRIIMKLQTIEGTVAKVGLSDTTIVDAEGVATVVPNRAFALYPLLNFSKKLAPIAEAVDEEESAQHNVFNKFFKKKEEAPPSDPAATAEP